LGIVTVLGMVPNSRGRAWAQDTPPSAEAPKRSTASASPANVQQEPAPADAQKEPKSAPAPPDAQKQSKPAAAPGDEPAETAPVSTEALSARYRFSEKYGLTEDPGKPDLVTQYRVGARETVKMTTEKAQGAPDRSESVRKTIYTERAAAVSRLGEATDSVRRYDRDELTAKDAVKPPSLQGLTIWYHRQPGDRPHIVSLASDHPIRETDYEEICAEGFVPQWMALLPQRPTRVGDTWNIPPQAARLVWARQPEAEDYELTGRLIEVGKAATGTGLTAVIGVSGRFWFGDVLNMFNAKIHFTFEPSTNASAPVGPAASPKVSETGTKHAAGKRDEGIIDARGWINLALMAQTAESVIPETEGRLKQYKTRELVLERRRLPTRAGADGSNPGLNPPATPPADDESNSWVLYDDPKGRFHFRHPQELIHNPSTDPNFVDLVLVHPSGDSRLGINFQGKTSDPVRDRQNRDPEFHRRRLYAIWEKQDKDVVRGSAGFLADPEWTDLKRKVYRAEVAVKPKGREPDAGERLYVDNYLVLFPNNESIVLMGWTEQDSNLKLRAHAEGIIKTFQLGASAGPAKAPAANTPGANTPTTNTPTANTPTPIPAPARTPPQ
jgi:hypothetical protein